MYGTSLRFELIRRFLQISIIFQINTNPYQRSFIEYYSLAESTRVGISSFSQLETHSEISSRNPYFLTLTFYRSMLRWIVLYSPGKPSIMKGTETKETKEVDIMRLTELTQNAG